MFTDHLHPLSVHFPIALILAGFLFDVFSLIFRKEKCLSKAGFWLMILGTLSAVAAYLTGEFFSRDLIGPAGEHKEIHELWAKTTMFTMLGALIIRVIAMVMKKDKGPLKWLVFGLYLAGAGLVSYTGFLGGSLVYDIMLNGGDAVATEATATETQANLKKAIIGETTANARYTAFAQIAREEGFPSIAVLFESAAASENIHARDLTEALTKLGGTMDAVNPEFTTGTTRENLEVSLNGESEEFSSTYPSFIKQAEADKADPAINALQFAMESEKAHVAFLTAAIKAMESNTTKSLPTSYSVCPRCGYTYATDQLPDACELCGTAKASFKTVKF